MTDDQHDHLAAYAAVETVLDAHPEPLGKIPAASRAIDDFRDRLGALRQAAQAQNAVALQGPAKSGARDRLADATFSLSQAVAAWAEDEGDLALADQVAFTRTDLRTNRQQTLLDRAALVHDAARDHLADLGDYDVSKDHVDALDALIAAFAAALGQPRHAVAERKAQTEAIERLFPEIDRLLTRRLDRHVARLDGTPFHAEYVSARRIVGH